MTKGDDIRLLAGGGATYRLPRPVTTMGRGRRDGELVSFGVAKVESALIFVTNGCCQSQKCDDADAYEDKPADEGHCNHAATPDRLRNSFCQSENETLPLVSASILRAISEPGKRLPFRYRFTETCVVSRRSAKSVSVSRASFRYASSFSE